MSTQIYTITVSGCDDHTTVEPWLTEAEADAVARVARQITAKSGDVCMPTMHVERWVDGARVECVPTDDRDTTDPPERTTTS